MKSIYSVIIMKYNYRAAEKLIRKRVSGSAG